MIRFNRKSILPLLGVLLFLVAFAGASALAQDTDEERLNKAKEYYNEGVQMMKNGDTAAALTAYQGAISMDADYADAYLNVGVIYFGRQNYDLALESFRTASEKDPQNVDALANLGRVQTKLRRNVEAEASFAKALEITPGVGDLLKELGQVQYKNGNHDGAIATLTKAHEAGSESYISWFMLGKSQQKQGNEAAAITALKKSAELETNYNALSALGSIYLAQGKFRSAATQFKAAMKASPKRGARAAYNYAIAMEQADSDDVDANIANWQNFVKLAKNNPKERDNVAIAKSHVDELKELKAHNESEL